MGTIQIKRGLSTNLPNAAALAEILYTTDTKRLYIGNGGENGLTEIANFEELLELLNNRAEKSHTHEIDEIINFEDSVDERITIQKGNPNGIATLDENGLVPQTQIPTIFKEAEVVADIAERDSLTPFSGLHALVLNATDDPTVEKGGAEYIYNGEKWLKISELADLDAIITWDKVTNKPYLVENLLDLSDTPTSFTNQSGKVLAVKHDESGLEFTNIYTGDVDGGTF